MKLTTDELIQELQVIVLNNDLLRQELNTISTVASRLATLDRQLTIAISFIGCCGVTGASETITKINALDRRIAQEEK